MLNKLKIFFIDLLFPKLCFGCQREGNYLCQDCKSIIDVLNFHKNFKTEEIDDLYFSTGYKKQIVKELIQKFKYQPFIKELSSPLSSLIINHLQLLDNPPLFCREKTDFILIPIPLQKKRLKWRGFNQSEEIARKLAEFLRIPLLDKVLFKRKETSPQVKLSEKERKENLSDSFFCKNREKILGKKILLVDDIFTTGFTMKEAAKVLKNSGAEKVIGIVVARALPGEDNV